MKKWFTIPSLIQLIITIGFIGFILIEASLASSQLALMELHKQMQRQVGIELSQRLESALQLNQMHYDHIRHKILDLDSQANREPYFTNHIKLYPDIAMTYVGLPDGSFYGARRTSEGMLQVVRNNESTKGC